MSSRLLCCASLGSITPNCAVCTLLEAKEHTISRLSWSCWTAWLYFGRSRENGRIEESFSARWRVWWFGTHWRFPEPRKFWHLSQISVHLGAVILLTEKIIIARVMQWRCCRSLRINSFRRRGRRGQRHRCIGQNAQRCPRDSRKLSIDPHHFWLVPFR